MTDTFESIKTAEAIVGAKMAEPYDVKERAKVEENENTVEYHFADSDDEDEETVETRKSVKTAEKMLKHRFFINAKEQRDYEKAVVEGRISQKELEFAEDSDDETGPEAE